MDTEKVILLSGLGFGLVVGAFILFGPSTRPKRRSGQVCGLINLGNTCFLNSLLQALASCPVIIEWLSHYDSENNTFIGALHKVLQVVNGQHPFIFEDPYTPEDIIQCLYRKGWTISPEEHDVHELLNVIMTTIEEEINHPGTSNISSLVDLLCVEADKKPGSRTNISPLIHSEKKNISSLSYDSGIDNVSKSSQLNAPASEEVPEHIRNDVALNLNLSSESNSCDNTDKVENKYSGVSDIKSGLKCGDSCEDDVLHNGIKNVQADYMGNTKTEQQLSNSAISFDKSSDSRHSEIQNQNSFSSTGIVKYIMSGIKNSQLNLSKGSPLSTVPPCEGLLAGQTVCTRCYYKSPVKYDKFSCISLNLPPSKTVYPCRSSLQQLLGKFVSPELISGVSCANCEKLYGKSQYSSSSIFKTCNVGKLPPCLIFHIQRTTWQSSGMSKRHDYIEFPEILPMHTYTYGQVQKKMSDFSPVTKDEGCSKRLPAVIDRFKHLYRLSAVIVHRGDVEHGHFVTYRRSPLHPNSWYYISDTEVLETALSEVLQTLAYMLFYTRCQPN